MFAEGNCQWEGRKLQEIDCCIEELTEKRDRGLYLLKTIVQEEEF